MSWLWLQDWCGGSVPGGPGLQLAWYVLRLCCKSFWLIRPPVGALFAPISDSFQLGITWNLCLHLWTQSFSPPLSLFTPSPPPVNFSFSLLFLFFFCKELRKSMLSGKQHLCLDLEKSVGSHLQSPGLISTSPWTQTLSVCLSVCLLSSLKLCQINLEGKTFYSKKDKPLCKGHAFAPVWESELHLQTVEHFSLTLSPFHLLLKLLQPAGNSYSLSVYSMRTPRLVNLDCFFKSVFIYPADLFHFFISASHDVTLVCCQENSDVTIWDTKCWVV